MGKWIAGVAATVLSGTLVYWLTQGVRTEATNTSDPATRPAEGGRPRGALTLFDLAGVYSLKHIEPGSPIHPQGLGIAIQAHSASEGRAKYRLPIDMNEIGLGDIMEDESPIVFTGSALQIKFGKEFSLWRNVQLNGRHLILSWDASGQAHSWTFERND